MKRILAVLLCLATLLSFAACNPAEPPETTGSAPTAPVVRDPAQPPEEETPEQPLIPTLPGQVKTTLMIYMIGSDLESKGAAATTDLEEIAASGIDPRHNVVVYAGGAKRWHGAMENQPANTVLALTDGSFSVVDTREDSSMGQPENLTEFLQYCYENHPADRYALVLWNHGNGPLMGYGKDETHGGDALLLEEMTQAMAASPFGPENKLSWVGFDACLMASAELACVWADYADFMVSSQEIEPSFGWNYGFLKNLGAEDVPALLCSLADLYMHTCQVYYDDRGYDHRDTTLSCVDLSAVPRLKDTMDALFARATADVNSHYNILTVRRVQTRALGRASTGSEYDLIDLKDMALQLQTLYPEESAALQKAVEDMVITNRTNTELCCGMSLYYPFHNKKYYEKSWKDIYTRLGLFPAYQQYLSAYGEIWQQNDKIKQLAAAVMPEKGETAGTYCLPLTKEQSENFAAAKYYILQRAGEGVYLQQFVSNDVTNVAGVLVANFDGNIIYVRNDYGSYHIPVVLEHDRVGDLARYSITLSLDNIPAGLNSMPEGVEMRVEGFRYHLTLNRDTGELSVSALLPREQDPDPDTIFTGKAQEPNLDEWHTAIFFDQPHRYPTRDENGVLLPFAQWDTNTRITGIKYPLSRGLDFVYEPLDGGEYYLMIEAQDTQGNSYCSEMLPISVPDRERPKPTLPQVSKTWDSGSHILLTEENGVQLYLTTVDVCGIQRYNLELRNLNDFPVYATAGELILNNALLAKSSWGAATAQPGQTIWLCPSSDLSTAETAGFLKELSSLQFDVEITNLTTGRAVLTPHRYQVTLGSGLSAAFAETNGSKPSATYVPHLGALAEKQILFTDDTLEITLLAFGAEENTTSGYNGWLCIENKKDRDVIADLSAIALNQVYMLKSGGCMIPAGGKGYLPFEISRYTLQGLGFTGIHQLSLLVNIQQQQITAFSSFGRELWCDVQLKEAAPPETAFREGSVVIWEKDGVRLALDPPTEGYRGAKWRMTLFNSSDRSLSVATVNTYLNGQLQDQHAGNVYISGVKAGPGQYAEGSLDCTLSLPELQQLSFCVQLRSLSGNAVLATDSEIITVTDIQWPKEVLG